MYRALKHGPKPHSKAAQHLHKEIINNRVTPDRHTKVQYTTTMKGIRSHYNTYNKYQLFHPRARLGGSTRASSTKCGYIISHLDGSKTAVESGPLWGGATMKLSLITDFFILLDFLCGALSSSGLHHRDLCKGAAWE
jgi:hypothetical protein